MRNNKKLINIVVVFALLIQGSVAFYSSKQDRSGLGAALFVFLMVMTLVAWPIILAIDKRVTAKQVTNPLSPQQAKRFKLIRAIIIVFVLAAIIKALLP